MPCDIKLILVSVESEYNFTCKNLEAAKERFSRQEWLKRTGAGITWHSKFCKIDSRIENGFFCKIQHVIWFMADCWLSVSNPISYYKRTFKTFAFLGNWFIYKSGNSQWPSMCSVIYFNRKIIKSQSSSIKYAATVSYRKDFPLHRKNWCILLK
jgi:hypothetical protein